MLKEGLMILWNKWPQYKLPTEHPWTEAMQKKRIDQDLVEIFIPLVICLNKDKVQSIYQKQQPW